MRGSVSVSLLAPESDHHTENLQFLKVLEKQKKSIVLYLLRGGPEWLHRLYIAQCPNKNKFSSEWPAAYVYTPVLFKMGETVPTDICVPPAAWCRGQSTATQQPTMDQTYQQTCQGVTNNHGDELRSAQGALGDATESYARRRRAPVHDRARNSVASPGAPWVLLSWLPW